MDVIQTAVTTRFKVKYNGQTSLIAIDGIFGLPKFRCKMQKSLSENAKRIYKYKTVDLDFNWCNSLGSYGEKRKSIVEEFRL